jgi:hypothetical protein
MFIVVNISFAADKNAITFLLVWLLIVWYLFACFWHLSDRGLRPPRLYLKLHSWRLITYVSLLMLLYLVSLYQISPLYRYAVMIAIISSMILWNAYRLTRFLRRDSRVYLCDYLGGYPERDLPEKGGRLELIRYPIRMKIGDNGKDYIKFESINRFPIEVFAEDIIDVNIKRVSSKQHGSDLVLSITCNFSRTDGTVEKINVLFNLNDQIIASVGQGIKELSERNKNANFGPVNLR